MTDSNPRQQRGLIIAATAEIRQNGQKWIVPSQSGNGGKYYVVPDKIAPRVAQVARNLRPAGGNGQSRAPPPILVRQLTQEIGMPTDSCQVYHRAELHLQSSALDHARHDSFRLIEIGQPPASCKPRRSRK